jgi:hypothetical protein
LSLIARRRSWARAAASSSETSSTIVLVIWGAQAYRMVPNLDIWRAVNLLIRERTGADQAGSKSYRLRATADRI